LLVDVATLPALAAAALVLRGDGAGFPERKAPLRVVLVVTVVRQAALRFSVERTTAAPMPRTAQRGARATRLASASNRS
jgi:hypothetical protein